jgi:hypothetical protein
LIAVLALGLVMVGCSAAPEPPATATPEPLKTPKPTFTPVPTDTPVAVATLAPTATPVPPTATPEPTATLDALVNPLSGLRVADEALLHRRPLAVRVGNDASIRPQEGLGQAEIVYEEIMEGRTLTRFTAIFYASNASRIRPIRSARLVSLAIAPQYDAALVHSGASDQIRWLISQAGFVDLDQYFHPDPYGVLEGYDWRGRMYASVQAVHAYLTEQGLEREAPIAGYLFAADAPMGQAATAVHVPYPELCVVDWSYDASSGRYLRQVQGQPHLDGLTSKQIGAENVVVLYAEHNKTDIVEDSLGSTAIDIVLTGSGRVQVFRDGVVATGEWRQTTSSPLIQFYDAENNLIPLKPGQTWIELVPPDYEVTF